MRVLNYSAIVLMLFVFTACVKTPSETGLDQSVEDLSRFPQSAHAYMDNVHSHSQLSPSQKSYDEKYFMPWNYTKPPFSKESILWPYACYVYGTSFGENLQPLDESWFTQMKERGNFEEYGTLGRKAISLRYLNLRNFPTHKPLFRDPNRAGEGFPFDYMQNSGVHANEPIYISHLSSDGEWAYVFTSYATGWTPLNSLAFIDDKVADTWQKSHHIELIDEHFPIKDLKEKFVFRSRVGMRLPIISIEPMHYVALAITVGKNHSSIYTKVKVPLSIAQKEKMNLNAENLERITELMLKSHYGWGGLYEERDCSSMLRDLYAPFGIWLPRNSSEQSKAGKVVSFGEISIEEKKEMIIKEGIPFETLLYKKGHILLYLGQYEGEIAVLHNVWGVKTLKNSVEGRKVIGRAVISSLELGKEREDYNPQKGILSQIISMNIITQE